MEKVVLVLDGYAEGKNIFQETIKTNGYWTWNLNTLNVVSKVAKIFGHDGERNARYYEYAEKQRELANEYFDFERAYILSMIDKFMEDQKANVLIIHNCDGKFAVELQGFYANCFDVLITNTAEEDDTYCKTLNYTDPEYVDSILSMMRVMTKPFGKGDN